MALSVETCIAQHIGDRQEQQDRITLLPHPSRRGLFMAVLADGMGGHTGGGIAADQVLHKAQQNFELYAPASETPEQLLRGIIEDAHVVIKLTRFTSEMDPHTTACVLMFQPARVDWVHCGDSRVYHFRDAQLVRRTLDHSLVECLAAGGKIAREEMHTHPRRNVLLGCLGSERVPLIDHGYAEAPRAGDAFLLCSDGLWAHFSDAELGETLAQNCPRAAADALVQQARERARGKGDNLSLAIVKLVERASTRPARR